MDEAKSLCHTRWDCKYHVVFIPKCRRKQLFLELRAHLGKVFRELARQKESSIEEGHMMLDHVHMLISIPPKYAVSQVVGYIKGKSAIHIARTYCGRVSTVGRNEQTIREYIQNQEKEDKRLEQLKLFDQ